jgi:argininosuccinate lyase
MLISMTKLWGGRFKVKTSKTAEVFTSSVSFDARLWKYDIEGSIAHVRMLGKQKIIPQKEARLIVKGLKEIRKDILESRFRFHDSHEDVHMNIEHALIRKVGPAGGRLHTARSRNDQVALDLRLYVKAEIDEILKILKKLQKALIGIAEKHLDTVMPGYTHLQRAQPVLLSHHILAYFEMLERDRERLEDCRKRTDVLPLGSAALAGTTLPIDRSYVAKLLGFSGISENSMDAVSDRDFVMECLSASGIIMVHLSRLSEELVLWCSEEFGFADLPDAYSTGSSIMPQKKNPDIPELVRGKSGRVFGNLVTLLTVAKGLPLTYNRDLQEDKEPLFDTVDTVKACLHVLSKLMKGIRFNKKAMEKAAEGGFTVSTNLAEYLVKKGLPFRDAHRVSGRVVRYCIDENRTINDLTYSELSRFSSLIDRDVYSFLTLQASISGRSSFGGTSRKNVLRRIRAVKDRM